MKTPLYHLRIFGFAAILTASTWAPVQAATLVNFTGDDTGSDAPNFTLGSYTIDGADKVRSMAYSTTGLNAAPTDSNGLPIIYGAAYQASIGGAANAYEPSFDVQVATGGSPQPDRLRFIGSRGATNSDPDNLQRVVVAIGKDNFLGSPANAVVFDASSSLSFDVSSSGNGNVTSMNLLVQDSGTWYISESFISGSNQLTINDPNSENWAVFDMTASTNFGGVNGGSISGSAHTFTDVQAVGFFFEQTWPGSGMNNGQTDLRNFTVEATVIPEPTAAVLMVASLPALLIRRRRQR